MTAFVFNCHYNGLSIIRELGGRDVDIYALDDSRSVGTYSRYGTYRNCPNPMVSEREFVDYLLKQGGQRDGKPVLFPTNDHWAMAISKHKEELSEQFHPCVADWHVVDKLIHKQQFYDWATERDYPVPRSWDYEEVDRIPEDAFPVAAKPEYRRVSSNDDETEERLSKFNDHRLEVLETRTELESFAAEKNERLRDFIFQEYVRGLSDRMYTVGVYADRASEVLGMFTGRKLRGYPPDIGNCKLGQSENLPSSLKETVKELCRDLEYTGIAEFEFKRDEITGEFQLIEINPRSWSWIGITPSCGVSLPWIAYADMKGIRDFSYIESRASTGEVKWVRVLEDLPNCLYRNGQAGFTDWDLSLSEWWRSVNAETVVTAEFDVRDPLPGVHSLYAFARSCLAELWGRQTGHG